MKRIYVCLSILMLLSLPIRSFGTWYDEGVPSGSDLVIMDLNWPWQPPATYYANWNGSFNPQPNRISYYSGFVTLLKDGPDSLPNPDRSLQQNTRMNFVWSFWGSDELGNPVRFIDVPDNVYIRNEYGGEGLSGTLGNMGGWPFIKPDYSLPEKRSAENNTADNNTPEIKHKRWYTMAARIWQPTAQQSDPTGAYFGRWIKDIDGNRWYLIGVAWLPIRAVSLRGNSGFIEPLSCARAVRPLCRRLGYSRKDGVWHKTNTTGKFTADYVVVNTIPEGDHEYLSIEYSQRPDHLPLYLTGDVLGADRGTRSYTVRQPDTPTLDTPILETADAVRVGQQMIVRWSVPHHSSPIIGYRIKVLNSAAKSSADTIAPQPIVIEHKLLPAKRLTIVDLPNELPANAPLSVRLVLYDIFDQQTEPRTITPTTQIVTQNTATPNTATRNTTVPSAVEKRVSGLSYRLYTQSDKHPVSYFSTPDQNPNEAHYWLHLAEITADRLQRQGISRGLDLSILDGRTVGYALKFSGFLRVPKDGAYLFRTAIDGAYRLTIDGRDVIVRDEQWGTSERNSWCTLTAGEHRFELDYLYDELPAHNFTVEWSGPGFDLRPFSAEDFQTEAAEGLCIPQIQAQSFGNGSVRIVVTPSRTDTLSRTTLYLGNLKLAESTSGELVYEGPLPVGVNRLTARCVDNNLRTADSEPVELTVTTEPVSDRWIVKNIGNQNARFSISQTNRHDASTTTGEDSSSAAANDSSSGDSFSFFGNGLHTVCRPVEGDFTLTCRVDDWNGRRGEPVNSSSWIGLSAMERVDQLNWEWGQMFYLIRTAKHGVRTAPGHSDLGGTRLSRARLPENHLWMRIVRRGNVWTAWSSEDGNRWHIGAVQIKNTPRVMNVGLFYSSLDQYAAAHYSAKVSHLTIVENTNTGGANTDSANTDDANTGGANTDSVIPAPATAKTTSGDRWTGLVAATSADTTSVDTTSTGAASAGKTTAGTPEITTLVLRSNRWGLVRTTDGGETWTAINGTTFNGAGRSSDKTGFMCVRSVAVHPQDPKIMLRACGTGEPGHSSLWKTVDAGQTWSQLTCPGDFDGQGPSALCGEIVQFDLKNPDILYVGTETQGLFRSSDGGETWTNVAAAGARVTAVSVWPFENYFPSLGSGKTQWSVVTCPDRFMQYLGRGEPMMKTDTAENKLRDEKLSDEKIRDKKLRDDEPSRLYLFAENGDAENGTVRTIQPNSVNPVLGYYNVFWDKQIPTVGEIVLATSHGHASNSGGHVSLYPASCRIEWLRPRTALGAAGLGEGKYGLFYTMALDPEDTTSLERSEWWAMEWSPQMLTFVQPSDERESRIQNAGGLIAVCPERVLGQQWFFLFTNGLFRSDDGGITLRRIMPEVK